MEGDLIWKGDKSGGRHGRNEQRRAKARSQIPFAVKYNNACRVTWVLLGGVVGWWWGGGVWGWAGRGGCECAQMQGALFFFTDTGVRAKLHPCRFRKMVSAFREELKGVTRFRVT